MLRYVPRKPSPVGLLVNNLAGSTAHEKPVCIVLMPQLKGRPPREILEDTVSLLQRYQHDSAFPSPITVVSDSFLGHCVIVELGSLLSGTSLAMRCTNFCSLISAGLKKG